MSKVNFTGLAASPATPSTGKNVLYFKTDKRLYTKDDTGLEGRLQTLALGTPVASTSGTSIDFTSIPAGTKRITINFVGVSTNGTSNPLVQIGDAGGIEATGYLANSVLFDATPTIAFTNYTTGFGIATANAASIVHGTMTLTLVDSATFTWAVSGVFMRSDADRSFLCAGSKSLSAELDRVRITTVGGTDTFDLGKINISYE